MQTENIQEYQAFCWKFVLVRAVLLIELEPHLRYQLVGVREARR